MSKKLIYLFSFALWLGLVLTSAAEATDPSLVLYLPFHEGTGEPKDFSVYKHGVELVNNPNWVDGKYGKALEFDGTNYVRVPINETLQLRESFTVEFWVKREDSQPATWNYMVAGGTLMWAVIVNADQNVYVWSRSGGTWGQRLVTSIPLTTDWTHIALTYDVGSGVELYFNGEKAGEGGTPPVVDEIDGSVMIGARNPGQEFFAGIIDEVALYNRILTLDEIRTDMEAVGEPWPYALGPTPPDGALYEDTWVNLGWSPGDSAVSHDVYIGENFDDVNDGTGDTFQGNQAVTNLIVGFPGFAYPDGLVPGTTYYWRIDEVNDTEPNSPWKGDVWSFWIPPYTAYNPNPADGVKFVPPDVELNWTAGFGAKLHHVYFGENFDDVNSAVVGLPQAATSYTPGTLELDKTYYWRIDEFDAVTTHKGDVWSFKTLPFIPITDPNLIAWWKLDEGSGNTALDGSGHNHHGTIGGTPDFVPGYNGDALDFDGSTDYIDVDGQLVSGTFSLTMWIYPRDIPYSSGFYAVLHNDAWNAGSLHVHLRNTTSIINADINSGPGVESTTVLQADQWYHCALTVTTTGGNASKLYINGVLENTGSGGTGTPYLGPMVIGAWDGGTTRHYHGLMDDIRIYDKVLTVEEITLAMRGDPLLAWDPNPTHGSTLYIRDATPFNWSPGDNASQHDVYFGTDRDAVADANATDTTGIYRGRQGVTIYTPPDVEWGGGPYYWRIDEYNTDATISKGNVWSFTVTDFIGIDDFEDYNDYEPDRIFDTWIDGWEVPTNGSMAGYADPPFAETNIVHGGGQSMPVSYDNNFMYSEVSITLVYPRDWTEEGVGVLSLWFYGDASNAAERMYVALNGSATVYHDNPDAALIEEWTEWTIDLQEFAAQGVNLANVNTIAIGFGDKNNLQAGGSGLVFFDDIRLYRPTP